LLAVEERLPMVFTLAVTVVTPSIPERFCNVAKGTTKPPLTNTLLALKIPSTVNVLLYAVNVEPTTRLFFLARALPTSATSAEEFPLMAVPDVIVTEFAPKTVALSGSVDPVTVTGSEKLVGTVPFAPALPPPNRLPSDPGLIEDVNDVVPPVLDPPKDDVEEEFERRSLTEVTTEVTFFVDEILDTSAAERGLPPPLKPCEPAGVTVMVVPTDWARLVVRLLTAWTESSITSARPKLIERMSTIETVRMVLRYAFFTPRWMVLTNRGLLL
jgi:hypothetical protein